MNQNANNSSINNVSGNTQKQLVQERRTMSEKRMQNNYMTEKLGKTSCICYTNYDESFVKNSHCRFCNRFIEINNKEKNKYPNDYSIRHT